MATSLSYFKSRYHWTDYYVALSIVAGAAVSCVLCFLNDNAGTSVGVLLVFGMALIAVLAGRSDVRPNLPIQQRKALKMRVMHETDFSKQLASSLG